MPGPNSKPNGTLRHTPQTVPAKLAARIADYQQMVAALKGAAPGYRKPGSQKR